MCRPRAQLFSLNVVSSIPSSALCGTSVLWLCALQGFYGYSTAPGVDRVASLNDNQTLLQLQCARCPAGVFCSKPGTEFHLLILQKGMWQDYLYCNESKVRRAQSRNTARSRGTSSGLCVFVPSRV